MRTPETDRPLRFAVVGLGYWGPNLVRNLYEIPNTEVALLCDSDEATLRTVAQRYPGVPTTARFADVLSSDVDAVVIATPVSTHFDLASQSLQAGKHTFVEKPLAASSAECCSLAQLARANERVLMPGHTFLYSPPVVRIKELIESGELGEIYFISSSRVNLGLHQPDVSVVWDLGPHDFSILRFWLGEVPVHVSAVARSCVLPGTPDVAFVDLTFPSGTVAHVEMSWLAPSKLRRTAIVGSQKMVVYDDTSNESVRVFDSGAHLRDPETFGEYRMTYRTGDIVSPRIDATEPLALELEDFCSAIREGTPLRSSAEVGIDVVRTIEAVDRSLASGGIPVSVNTSPAGPDLDEQLRIRIPRVQTRRRIREEGDERGGESIGTAVLGAGPAGLTAAHVLSLRREPGAVFEADGVVGGIAKTVEVDGYRFDLGGHRFFTKLEPIQRLWEQMLGDHFLIRPRLSRIYSRGKYFSYPLTAKDVLGRFGLWESFRCAMSYLRAVRHRNDEVDTFEEWVTNRFGGRLYDVFFRSYTEKVWGIPGTEIRSLWAAQRIKNFSLWKAMLTIVGLKRQHVTTLIEEFRYPRRGPGQMWEAFQKKVEEDGVPVHLKQRVIGLTHHDGYVETVKVQRNGTVDEHQVDGVLSSLALSDLVLSLEPAPPAPVLAAARRLRYRDLCLVALMSTEPSPFPDNWIYLHDPGVRAGRVQNFGAWSPDMVRPGTTCLGVEYFCFRGDEIWEMSEAEIVKLATAELAGIGLIDPEKVFDGVKVLVPKAYPIYDAEYERSVAVIRAYLEQFHNLETFGRNGLHRYNNQDHSMWTAILATLNYLDGTNYDVWSVNAEAEYLEEGEIVSALLEPNEFGLASAPAEEPAVEGEVAAA